MSPREFLGTGVPALAGGSKVPECPLRAESRAASLRRTPSFNTTTERAIGVRHPSTKSVQIKDDPGDCEQSDDVTSGSDEDLLRHPSTGSLSSAVTRRQSTGPEPTSTQTEAVPNSHSDGRRTKAYHFDDDPVPCRDSDMKATAHSLLRHDPPARRHSVYDPSQRVNKIAPTAAPPAPTPPIVQGFVIPPNDVLRLSQAASLMLGPLADVRTAHWSVYFSDSYHSSDSPVTIQLNCFLP